MQESTKDIFEKDKKRGVKSFEFKALSVLKTKKGRVCKKHL